jgi:hypothetical protein
MIEIGFGATSGYGLIWDNGKVLTQTQYTYNFAGATNTAAAIIPSGDTYYATPSGSVGIVRWMELR